MKILLSAYACEPNKGSEPGVGWNWAIELTKFGQDVWVLTRSNNRESIENELAKNPGVNKPHFIYYDLPVWARRLKKNRGGIYPYYIAWQLGALKIAQKIHIRENFSIVHHITFGVIRLPSFMGQLGIPFLLGPLGGGESAPFAIQNGYPLRGRVVDGIRELLNMWVRFDPLMNNTFKTASVILLKTPDSKKSIPHKFHYKTKVQIEIGTEKRKVFSQKPYTINGNPFRLLFVGRFIYWKGMHIGLEAFSRLLMRIPDARLTMVGRGPEEKEWKNFVKQKKIDYAVTWIPWVNQNELQSIYRSHDIFLFPSFHDSSGNVILEAMTNGLPVVCLDCGGPGVIVDDSCGIKVSVQSKSKDKVINDLVQAIEKLILINGFHEQLSRGAITYAMNHGWSNVVQQVCSGVFDKLENNS